MEQAKKLGLLTISLTCVAGSEMAAVADIAIAPVTGPEVVTGSTRLKAGTATKLVLNMLSTGVMIRTGAVYGNLMVNVQATNEKLVDRAQRIIAEATGVDRETAARLLAEGGSVKVAIAMQKLGLDRSAAEAALNEVGGVLAKALATA
jgi:N-acetylmuramic acid 6-phosphate etherase